MTKGTEDHREVGGIAGAMSHEPEAARAGSVCSVCGGPIAEAPWGVRVTGAGLALACGPPCAQSDFFRLPMVLLDPEQLKTMETALKAMRLLGDALLGKIDDALDTLRSIKSNLQPDTKNPPKGRERTSDGNESDVADA